MVADDIHRHCTGSHTVIMSSFTLYLVFILPFHMNTSDLCMLPIYWHSEKKSESFHIETGASFAGLMSEFCEFCRFEFCRFDSMRNQVEMHALECEQSESGEFILFIGNAAKFSPATLWQLPASFQLLCYAIELKWNPMAFTVPNEKIPGCRWRSCITFIRTHLPKVWLCAMGCSTEIPAWFTKWIFPFVFATGVHTL